MDETAVIPASRKSLGHMALHCRPEDTLAAARFFELAGCGVKRFGPFPDGGYFHIVALDSTAPDAADNIIFLSPATPEQSRMELAHRAALSSGEAQAAMAAMAVAQDKEPEFFFHFGIHFAALEDLEATVQRLQTAIATEPQFATRIQGMQILRARRGRDSAEDARMDASPVFGAVTREAYGQHIAQVHIMTDLFTPGPGSQGTVVELDYVFTGPGRERNPFNDLIMD